MVRPCLRKRRTHSPYSNTTLNHEAVEEEALGERLRGREARVVKASRQIEVAPQTTLSESDPGEDPPGVTQDDGVLVRPLEATHATNAHDGKLLRDRRAEPVDGDSETAASPAIRALLDGGNPTALAAALRRHAYLTGKVPDGPRPMIGRSGSGRLKCARPKIRSAVASSGCSSGGPSAATGPSVSTRRRDGLFPDRPQPRPSVGKLPH